jgi:hypothetical protein
LSSIPFALPFDWGGAAAPKKQLFLSLCANGGKSLEKENYVPAFNKTPDQLRLRITLPTRTSVLIFPGKDQNLSSIRANNYFLFKDKFRTDPEIGQTRHVFLNTFKIHL